jgi:uncharacterized protein (DUF433 family)
MSEPDLSLSVSEVAALSGVSEKIVRNEIHRGIISSGKRRTQRKRWRFPPDAVAYFMLVSKISFPREDRQAVYELMATDKRRAGNWRKSHQDTLDRDNFLSINTKHLLSDSNKKLRLYKQGLRRIESRPEILSGEEVFKGTRLSVRHIGGMLRKGVTIENVKADYPALTIDDIRFAEIYSGVKRPPGRPTNPITFRRDPLD